VGVIFRNPVLVFFGIFTVVLLVSQVLPAKHRNTWLTKRLSPLLWGFAAFWFMAVFFVYVKGHAQVTAMPVFFVAFLVVGYLVRRKMWKDWAVNKYGRTKIVFDDPYGGNGSAAPPESPGPPPLAPAGWFADTSSRHQLRYWDGVQWTEHVSDNGVSAVDPVG